MSPAQPPQAATGAPPPANGRRRAGTAPSQAGAVPSQAGAGARAHALTALRQAILDGDVAPGQRLVEEDLAERLHVTRASLRAALLELTAEGLVERVPNKGARVRSVTTEEAVAITECRMALESLCAVKAAGRITSDQVSGLRALGQQLEGAVADDDPVKYSRVNAELHRSIRAISGQHVAVGLLERLNAQLVRHQFHIAQRPGRSRQSLAEHLAIIDAIAGRDPEAADQAVRRHLTSVIDALRAGGDRPGGTAAGGTAGGESPTPAEEEA